MKNIESEIALIGSDFYITCKFLHMHDIPQQTIYNNLNLNKKIPNRWTTKRHPTIPKAILIKYSTIPESFCKRHELPTIEYLEQKYLVKSEINSMLINKKLDDHIRASFMLAEYSGDQYREIYETIISDEKELQKYCVTHAIFNTILNLQKSKFKLIDLFRVYSQYPNLMFQTEYYKSFTNKIKRIRNGKEIEAELLHGLRGKRGNATKVSDDIIKLIIRHFSNPKKLNAPQILDLVNHYLINLNRNTISLSTVYRIIGNPMVKNRYLVSRYGIRYAEQELFPHSIFNPPKNPGELWQLDGTRCQFVYKTKKSRFNFLYIFVVFDTMSKKVVGCSLDNSENADMIMHALKKACQNTGYLPKNIIHDHGTSFNSQILNEFRARSKFMGTLWHKSPVGLPRDNGAVERFFGVFQESFCKLADGYLGDGITSKNINGKPNPEELKKHTNQKNLRTREQLITLIQELIAKYNQGLQGRRSPNSIHENAQSVFAKELNPVTYSQLFWKIKEITVRKSTIIFQYNNEQFIYIVYDEDFMLRYRNSKVLVRFDPDNMDEVFVFDIKDQYITKVKKYYPVPKVAANRTMAEHVRNSLHNKKIKGLKEAIIQSNSEVIEEAIQIEEKIPAALTEYTNVSKKEKEKAESEYHERLFEKMTGMEQASDSVDSNINSETLLEELKNLYFQKGNLRII